MRSRGLLVFVSGAVLAAAVAAYFVERSSSTPTGAVSDRLFPSMDTIVDEVASIEIETSQARLHMVRDGDDWLLPEKTNMAAQADKVRAIFIGLADLKAIEAKTSDPGNFARVGVDEPTDAGSTATRLTLRDQNNDELAALLLGNFIEGGTSGRSRFVRRSGRDQVWLAEPQFDVVAQASAWVNRSLLAVDGSRVESVVITHPDGEEVVIARDSPEQTKFVLESMLPGQELRAPGIANPITRALSTLTFDDVRSLADARPDASTVSVVFQTFDGWNIALHIGDEEGVHWTTIQVTGDEATRTDAAFVAMAERVRDRQFAIPRWAATNLTKRQNDFVITPEPAGP